MLFFWITDHSFWTGKYGMPVTVKKNSEPFQPEQRQIQRDFFEHWVRKSPAFGSVARVPQKSANSAPHQLQRLL